MRAMQRGLDEELAAATWRLVAARRVQRAWRRYAAGPQRARRAAAAAALQAAWRALAARRLARRAREEREAMRQVEAAAASGSPEAIQQAAQLATRLGVHIHTARSLLPSLVVTNAGRGSAGLQATFVVT